MIDVIEGIDDQLGAAGYPAGDRNAVQWALEEAVCNAIEHGHLGDPSRLVLLRCCVAETFFVAQVEDEGPGFDHVRLLEVLRDPSESLEPMSGLSAMSRYMTTVRFNDAGNCVTLCKHRSHAGRPAHGDDN